MGIADYEKPNQEYTSELCDAGWAPGKYICKCAECGKKHIADKRACRCVECAKKTIEEYKNILTYDI